MTRPNEELAAIFLHMADLLRGQQANPYRVRAYRRAAETLTSLDEDVAHIEARGELERIDGIGKDLSQKIREFLRTGAIQSYESLKQPLPPDIRRWASLPGLSETLVQHLYFRLNIRDLDDLAGLVRSHLLRTLPGFGGDEENLLSAIDTLRNLQAARPPST
ncbi:MAG: histidinol-phosphatase [Nitrospiraceae bacterium]